jgi:hypothetical protein
MVVRLDMPHALPLIFRNRSDSVVAGLTAESSRGAIRRDLQQLACVREAARRVGEP